MARGLRLATLRGAWIGAALGLIAACAGHKPPPPSSDIDEAGFRDDVRILASDDFEGRRPGSAGEDKTIGFLVAQFRGLGLKPGNGDSYLQPVPLIETRAAPDAALSIAGRGATTPLLYTKDMVIWTPREATEAVLQRSEMVFVGYGIVAPEFDWNDYAQVDVHGKTVVVLTGDPGAASQDPQIFKGNAVTGYGVPAYKFEEAARQGAAGILLIHEPGAAGYAWNVVVTGGTGPQLFAATADDAQRPAVEGWLSGAAARALFMQAGLDFAASTAGASKPGFKAIALGLTADAAIHNSSRRFTSPNVIAVLPGAQRKHEYIVYSAHWDHLGRQPAERGGAVFNGAVEDASGVAGLLMLAQSFVRTKPAADRSIVFIAFTGEESGLLGSAYYVSAPVFPLRQTVAVLNLEQLYIGGPTRDVNIFGFGNSELDEYLRDAALLQGREVRPDPMPELGLYYRSDQLSFARNDVPALFAKAGLDDSARGPEWGRARLVDYLAQRYHQSGDKYSADWDVRGTLEDLRLYYEVGNRLAHSRHFPRWYPNSEFRSKPHRDDHAPTQ